MENIKARKKRAASIGIAVGIGGIALSIQQLLGLSAVSYTGRLGWLKQMLYELFGPNAPSILLGAIGIIILIIGVNAFRSN